MRTNGISPLIDENVVIQGLSEKPKRENFSSLNSSAIMLIIDAWDRELTRDQFVAACGAALGLTDAVARLAMIHNVKDHLEETGEVTPADIEITLQNLTNLAQKHTRGCLTIAELIKQCAVEEDKVH